MLPPLLPLPLTGFRPQPRIFHTSAVPSAGKAGVCVCVCAFRGWDLRFCSLCGACCGRKVHLFLGEGNGVSLAAETRGAQRARSMSESRGGGDFVSIALRCTNPKNIPSGAVCEGLKRFQLGVREKRSNAARLFILASRVPAERRFICQKQQQPNRRSGPPLFIFRSRQEGCGQRWGHLRRHHLRGPLRGARGRSLPAAFLRAAPGPRPASVSAGDPANGTSRSTARLQNRSGRARGSAAGHGHKRQPGAGRLKPGGRGSGRHPPGPTASPARGCSGSRARVDGGNLSGKGA